MDATRYLRLLGIESVPAGLDGLRLVVRRHVCRVPFENLSKLLLFGREGVGRSVTLTEYLDGIEHHDLGGTCYSCNPFLADLLRALGYEAELLGADMSRPNVHTSLRVYVNSVPYHVDAGFGGPFREPIRLDRLPHEIVEGGDRYVLEKAPAAGGYEMAVFSGPDRAHGYTAHEPPRPPEFFQPIIEQSFSSDATFLNHLRICRIFDSHSVTLFDRTLSVYRGSETLVVELASRSEFASAIANQLGMPRAPWEAALQVLERVTGRPFFDASLARAVH